MSSQSGELSLLLISANVGSLFEQPDHLMTPWLNQFCSKVSREEPDFVALHCQEVGGKTYQTGMKYVQGFVDVLLKSPELSEYSRVRGFIDEDHEDRQEFTALGSVYLVHSRVADAALWDFSGSRFHPIADKEVKSGNLQADAFHKKLKYPPDFFKEYPWSRKGHIITRWRLRNRVVDIVNVHLFHDASNLESVSQCPSIYVANRCRALRHTLKKLRECGLPEAPLFIFGDFNFRTDLHGIVKHSFPNVEAVSQMKKTDGGKEEVVKLEYRDPGQETPVLTLEKKCFVLRDGLPSDLRKEWKQFDKEMEQFRQDLFEQEIEFPPSYPFSEDPGVTDAYMTTRTPSWCDRVLYNETAKELVAKAVGTEYGLMGTDAEMGDHKPVCMTVRLPAVTTVAIESDDSSLMTTHASNNGNNVAYTANSAGEPSAKRVNHSHRSSAEPADSKNAGACVTAAARVPESPAAAEAAVLWRQVLLLALIYCCAMLLLQYALGVDSSTAITTILLIAATVLYLGRRSHQR